MSFTISPRHLSASTDGESISLQSTSTTLHTGVAGATSFDDLQIWVTNTIGTTETLTIKVGTSTVVVASVPANAGHVLAAQLRVNGGKAVAATGTTNDALKVTGRVARWEP